MAMQFEAASSAAAQMATPGTSWDAHRREAEQSEECRAMRRALDADSGHAHARVVVSAAEPFAMQASNGAFTQLMGHSADGSALKILYGQTTRSEVLESTIVSAEQDGVCDCQLSLYTSSGNALLLRVQVSAIHAEVKVAPQRRMVLLSFMPAQHISR